MYIHRTLVTYTNRDCLFHANKGRVTATLSDLLFTRAVSCTIAVVKVDHVQGGATTNHVRREISISVPIYSPFWQILSCLTVCLEK